MIEVRQTQTFTKWYDALRDRKARVRIAARIQRAQSGNFGDMKLLGEGISEWRINYGPGYRVYFVQRGLTVIVLLAGGDKRTQTEDIRRAKELARQL